MTIEDANQFIREHEQDIESLAAGGNPLGRAIAILYELHTEDPQNGNAANVLALAVEELRDSIGSNEKEDIKHPKDLN